MAKDDKFKFTSVEDAWMGAYVGKGEEREFHKEMQKKLNIRRPKARHPDGRGGSTNDWITEKNNYGAKIAGHMDNDYDVRRTLEAKALAGDEFARKYAEKGVNGIESVHAVNEYLKGEHKKLGNNPDDFGSASDFAQITMAAVDNDRKVFNQSIDKRIADATAEKEEPVAEAPEEEYKPSRRLAQAQALVGTAKEDTVNNYIDIYKPNASKVSIDNLRSSYARDFKTDGVSVSADQGSKSQDFLDVYKQDVKESLKPA